MIRWLTANFGLKCTALLLALGIVFIKAQERISFRTIPNVKLTIENIPPGFHLAENWISPLIQMRVYGPKNVIDLIRPDTSYFFLDISKYPLNNVPSNITVLLTPDSFRSNLDYDMAVQFWVDESSITPHQIIIQTKSWDITTPQPKPNANQPQNSSVEIALHRMEKSVSVGVPVIGTPPSRLNFLGYKTNPESVTFAGRREALEQIQSVSTVPLDLSGVTENTLPIFLPLEFPAGSEAVPVDASVREVTVTLNVQKK